MLEKGKKSVPCFVVCVVPAFETVKACLFFILFEKRFFFVFEIVMYTRVLRLRR